MAGFFNKMNVMFLSLAAAACCCFAAARRQDVDKEVKSLWSKYEKAEASDEPKTALTYLELIKSAARERHLAWDYYDACQKAYRTELRTNWKLRESLLQKLDDEVARYSDPMMTVFHRLFSPAGRGRDFSKESLREYISKNQSTLRKASTPEFLSGASVNVKVQPLIEEGDFFKNDYQGALWLLSVAASDKDALQLLENEVGQTYPQSAWLEYYSISAFSYADRNARKNALKAFSVKYSGKAAALLADEDILDIRMDELEMNGKGTSQDYLKLRDDCRSFLSRQKDFQGDEGRLASCCKDASNLLERLESTQAYASVSDGVITLTTRNLESVNLSLRCRDGKKEIWRHTAQDAENSFYRADTTKVSLPAIDDGEYILVWSAKGVDRSEIEYSKYSVSVACRINDGRYEIYAADAQSGKPLEMVSGFELNGFTPVPQDIATKLQSKKYEPVTFTAVSPDGRKLMSREVSRNNFFYNDNAFTPYSSTEAVVLTDCAAFRPADIVKFKVIAYDIDVRENGLSEKHTIGRGEAIKVELIDPDGKPAGELSLTANEFGSASGEFYIPSGRKNGQYRIKALVRGNAVASASIVVGDYVLPSFEILADKSEADVYPGDTIRFTGKVKSYSGRIISREKSVYKVSGPEKYTASGNLELSADGTFCITVPSVKSGWYSYELSISDATGETILHNGGCGVTDIPDLSIDIMDTADGICSERGDNYRYGGYAQIVSGDELSLEFVHNNFDGRKTPATVAYTVTGPDGVAASGKASANEELSLILPGTASGLYKVEAQAEVVSASGQHLQSGKQSRKVLIVRKGSDTLASDTEYFVMAGENPFEAVIGTTEGEIWAVVNLVSSDGRLLQEKIFHMDGKPGRAGSICRVGFDCDLSSAVTMNILWFKKNNVVSWSHLLSASAGNEPLTLEISRFTDESAPGRETSVSFKTDPSAELLVTVFDKATEKIRALRWPSVRKDGPVITNINVSSVCGVDGDGGNPLFRTYASAANGLAMAKSASPMVLDGAPMLEEEVEMVAAEDEMVADVSVRDDFEDVIAFEPTLYPDKDGYVSFSFRPSGKLSTYIIKAYTHDKKMNAAQISREMLITLPVEVSMQAPQFLYVGDRYILGCSVSDAGDTGIDGGEIVLSVFDGNDRKSEPLMRMVKNADFKDGLASCEFEIPSIPACSSKEIGLMVTYSGKDASGNGVTDGVMQCVPVYDTVKIMTESHSSVFKSGMDRNAVMEQLRSSFTNLDSERAEMVERKIRDMIPEVLDASATAADDDVMSLMNALVVRMLSAELNSSSSESEELLKKISECLNPDGGYGWRAGMESSQMTTAYMLTAISMLRERGLLPAGFENVGATVKYLDREQFTGKQYWYGLSLEQYLFIRSKFLDVKFGETLTKEQKKAAKEYLTARDEKSMKGYIMGKVRRILTLDNLSASEDGIALARALGVSSGASRRLSSTRAMDMTSVRQYAVEHKYGGLYYPNAVMPFRGLLESEIYAHTLLCNLFAGEDDALADGLRLWLMLQKETQEWDSDPASVLAVAAIMDGSDELLQTSVISLTATGEQRFEEIKAASNGFEVTCKYYVDASYGRGDGDRWVMLNDGDKVTAGQRVKAEYIVHSDENRSFVRMVTPRPACLQPESQLSGRYGWRLYRDVRLNETQWWWDVFPEEDSIFSETFIVSRTGDFQYPAAVVTCMYAPHWSANTQSSTFRVSK